MWLCRGNGHLIDGWDIIISSELVVVRGYFYGSVFVTVVCVLCVCIGMSGCQRVGERVSESVRGWVVVRGGKESSGDHLRTVDRVVQPPTRVWQC